MEVATQELVPRNSRREQLTVEGRRLRLLEAARASGKCGDLRKGKLVHALATEHGDVKDVYVASSLVNMYAKCGSMADAHVVFNGISDHNAVCWNSLILGYATNGEPYKALELYHQMPCAPTPLTFVAALKACTTVATRETEAAHEIYCTGLRVHYRAAQLGCDSHIKVASTLVDLYAKCGRMREAELQFHRIEHPTSVTWNVLIMGYAENGKGYVSLEKFAEMLSNGCAPNTATFVAVLKACTVLSAEEGGESWLSHGRCVHSQAFQYGCASQIHVANSLIGMYSKCRSMKESHRVFNLIRQPTVVSWNCLILGYADNGEAETALDLMLQMEQHFVPNSMTIVAALKACIFLASREEASQKNAEVRKWRSLKHGKAVHAKAVEASCETNSYVEASLVDMYCKCGAMAEAREVFDKMSNPSVVSWNSLISGYADNGEAESAVQLYQSVTNLEPDAATFTSALKACGAVGAVELGKRIHALIRAQRFEEDPYVITCVVDFYGKCLGMEDARAAFDMLPVKDVVAWTALIAGYSRHGNTDEVFEAFHQMVKVCRLQPNGVTMLCILSTCSHAGLVDQGRRYFEEMEVKFQVKPSIEHYNCVVDMLGRANELEEAMLLIRSMPMSPNAVTWMTLLGACRKWKNVEVGKVAFECLLSMNSGKEPGAFVQMASIYRLMA